jgi:hypothetical protein
MGLEDLFGGLFGGGGGDTTQSQQPQEAGANPLASILLGVGAPLISKLMGQSTEKQITGAEKNLKTAGNTGTSIGEQLLKRAAAGQLTDPQQAQVDTMKREQNARNSQYLASLGIPVSTANVEMQNQTDQQALKMANDLINQSFQQGIQAMNLGGTASQQLLTQAMAQKKELSNTIGDVAKQIGQVLNTPGRKETPAVGAPNAVEEIASGAQSWGAGDFDPYANTIPADVSYT